MQQFTKQEITNIVVNKASELGFTACGFAKSEALKEESLYLKDYLIENRNGEMEFMANYQDKRTNPILLVENSKSIISVLINYNPKQIEYKSKFKIAKFALGKDYHEVIKKKLILLYNFIKLEIPEFKGRCFVDSTPIMEKAFAKKAGLGWTGKNTLLLTKQGSFHYLGEIICNIEFEYSMEQKPACGKCTKCIDACPTNALIAPYKLDARKCIAYQTIENNGQIPNLFKGKMQNYIYGCDICQDVCPYNQEHNNTTISEFEPDLKISELTENEWLNMDKQTFDQIFKLSSIKRIKHHNLQKNIQFINNQ